MVDIRVNRLYNALMLKNRQMIMWVVKRCNKDFEDVWRWTVGEFATEAEAETLRNQEEDSNTWSECWFEVEEA